MMDSSATVFAPLHEREDEADLDDSVIELVEKAQAENKNREVSDGKNREDIADKDYNYEDDAYEEDYLYKKKEKKFVQGSNFDSLDFTDAESLAWKRHKFRRYFTTKGSWFTPSKTRTIIHWCLLITLGISIALVGGLVFILTEYLTEWKLESSYRLMDEGNYAGGFFSFLFFSIFFILVSGFLCWKLPLTAGSGIPEIKSVLNGVDATTVLSLEILPWKIVSMCFSVAAGLPLGKEGPMIHAGSIMGCAMSQGVLPLFPNSMSKSWGRFQDLRNDYSKRDFITYGAASGIAAAFRAPIGGILFCLEESASFWSKQVSFRTFMCAAVTQLTFGFLFPHAATSSAHMFAMGQMNDTYKNRQDFFFYEYPIFLCMGLVGGLIGAVYNHFTKLINQYRQKHINHIKMRRIMELVFWTSLMAIVSFILPMCWQQCTAVPEETDDMPAQDAMLLHHLVRFQCKEGEYNQLASLYFTSGEVALKQLFHLREVDGEGLQKMTTWPILLFTIPYFLIASITAGLMVPSGLFIPALLSGAGFGRVLGHWLNLAFPGYVASAGTYALIGAAAALGGMARMTMAGCMIVLEAVGNMEYVLPLAVTFAGARVVGNKLTVSFYDVLMNLKHMPFLEGELPEIGMLNVLAISRVMTRNVVTLQEISKVSHVVYILKSTKHNAFPVVSKDGTLRGIILRKRLMVLLKHKVFAMPGQPPVKVSYPATYTRTGGVNRTSSTATVDTTDTRSSGQENDQQPQQQQRRADGGIELHSAASILYDALDKYYPKYPTIDQCHVTESEMNYWLDLRPIMDHSPPVVSSFHTIGKSYRMFRTMAMRHLVVIDGQCKVAGIVTRADMLEHRLEHFWHHEEEDIKNTLALDVLPPAVVYLDKDTTIVRGRGRATSIHSAGSRDSGSGGGSVDDSGAEYLWETDMEVVMGMEKLPDSPVSALRKHTTLR